MPEKNVLSRKEKAFGLAQADVHSMIVRITCQACRLTHRYLSRDLLLLCGDIGIHQIPRKFRCDKCKSKEWMAANWESNHGDQIGKLAIRRLVKVKYVRVPVWEDGIL